MNIAAQFSLTVTTVFALGMPCLIAQTAPTREIQASSSLDTKVGSTEQLPVVSTLSSQQQTLAASEQALINSGATTDQLAAWHKANAAQLAALHEQARAVSATSYLQAWPTNVRANIPSGASQAIKDLLTTRVALINARAQIHNGLVQQLAASKKGTTVSQVQQLQQQEALAFRQQYGPTLQLQAQRAQALRYTSMQAAASQADSTSFKVPTDVSPEVKALLTTQHQLMQSRMQLLHQYANASPAEREAALQKWQKQNVASFAQVRQEAQSLSQASVTAEKN